jgi:hypothetical protein
MDLALRISPLSPRMRVDLISSVAHLLLACCIDSFVPTTLFFQLMLQERTGSRITRAAEVACACWQPLDF